MKRRHRILVIEDDSVLLEQLAGSLEDEGYAVIRAESAEEGMKTLEASGIELVITDLKLPAADGLEVVRRTRARLPDCPVLVMTGHASVDTAVQAMRLGAFHYLQKPLSVDELLVEVQKALEHGEILKERQSLRNKLSSEQGLGKIIGVSPGMLAVKKMIQAVAKTDSTVLITGETGTGKELVANALHYEGGRISGPLVKVNCAALTESLLDSELFGHEKGAFTGADKRRAGRFERADGGTLVLDEITEMGEHVQAKLLRVLQSGEFERVGGDVSLSVDVRVIAITNRDPLDAVEHGKLRKDLYYRLNTVSIVVPPLRDRREDIPPLAEAFLELYAEKHGKNVKAIAPEALTVLISYDWPGNVRELEHCIERAVLLSENSVLSAPDVSPQVNSTATHMNGQPVAAVETLNLQELERQTILKALLETGWNKTRAAQKLGVFPSSLYKKMKRLDIPIQKQV